MHSFDLTNETTLMTVIYGFMVLSVVSSLLPFWVNYKMAKRRAVNMTVIITLTFFFSWLVTIYLAFVPKYRPPQPEYPLTDSFFLQRQGKGS